MDYAPPAIEAIPETTADLVRVTIILKSGYVLMDDVITVGDEEELWASWHNYLIGAETDGIHAITTASGSADVLLSEIAGIKMQDFKKPR